MSHYYFRIPGWPVPVLAVCLVVLSVVAPREWWAHYALLREQMVVALPVPEAVAEQPDPRVWELAALESPPEFARVAPPVSERIVLDPSILETPALPTHTPQRPELPIEDEMPPSDEVIKPQRLLAQDSEPIPTSPGWPLPIALIRILEPLKAEPETEAWANELDGLLERMSKLESLTDPESGPILDHLAEMTVGAEQMAGRLEDLPRSQLLRASYSTTRRVALWRSIHQLAALEGPPAEPALRPEALRRAVARVDGHLRQIAQTNVWREFLLLDQVSAIIKAPQVDAPRFRALARRILSRMDDPGLTTQQIEFLQGEPYRGFTMELKRWAIEPVDYRSMLVDLERYELDFNSRDGERVARNYQILRWSSDPHVVRVADQLNALYRNANVRIALAGSLINRLLPPPQQTNEESYDNILDADVHSYSQATTKLRVTLFPDRRQWRLSLEANGEVYSDSESRKGVAAFFNQAFGRFQARKTLLVDRRGVRVSEAEADASSDSSLLGLETDFDGVPFLNMLARSIAKQQYHEQSGQARREVESRMASRASERFDQEVHQRIERAEKEFKSKVLKPLRELDLKPTAVDMETTDKRLIVRERLAGDFQLAAHTPRPQAPGDSLLSMQIHESAMNNALEHLHLEQRCTDLRSLYRELADRFERKSVPIPDDVPDDVVVQFADENAVRVRCTDGRITLTIQLAELVHGKSEKWKNFAVRAHYVPTANQVEANLVRDGVIELAGERLSLRDQVALRAIFSRILSRNRTVSVVNKRLQENPQLAHLIVGQFIVQDGWIGVAMVGDRQFHVEEQTATHAKPSLFRK
ncbi:MAG: hypothetical protein FJ295_04005 [Planctomycetes bacterium]|nr:hypothetical protein [Planctomycetota bacterium]